MLSEKLLVRVAKEIRRRNYSYRTEKSYLGWIKRYIKFLNLQSAIANCRSVINKIIHMNKFELEERLINFAVMIIAIADNMENSKAANHLSG